MPQDVEFLMPYGARVADQLPAAMDRHLEWARKHGLLPSQAAVERYLFSQHVDVGAWFNPRPGEEKDLDLQLDINGWYFLLDDSFELPAGQSIDGSLAVCRELIEFLHCGTTHSAVTSPIAAAFTDIWRRERAGMSHLWRQRAAANWADYLTGNLAEEADRQVGTALDPERYLRVRRRSVGVQPLLDLRECAGPFEVPLLGWCSSHLLDMRTSTIEHIIFVNDVCSLEKMSLAVA